MSRTNTSTHRRVPDYTAIAEVTLYSFGFEASQDLAQRLTTLMKVVKSQLPRRTQYDFDMRALKTVLQRAGALRQEAVAEKSRRNSMMDKMGVGRPPSSTHSRRSAGVATSENAVLHAHVSSRMSFRVIPNQIPQASRLEPDEELQLCRTALLQINTPKLSEADTPVFLSCLRDFFPDPEPTGRESERDRDRLAMVHLIREAARVKGFEVNDIFVNQAIQLRDTMNYRHGIMMLGPASSGKTTTRSILAWAIEHWAAEQGVVATPSMTVKGVQKVNRKLIRIARERLKIQHDADHTMEVGGAKPRRSSELSMKDGPGALEALAEILEEGGDGTRSPGAGRGKIMLLSPLLSPYVS